MVGSDVNFKLFSSRAFAATLSIPAYLSMLLLSLNKGICPPLNEGYVADERFSNCQPLPHVQAFLLLRVLSVDPTPELAFCFSRFMGL